MSPKINPSPAAQGVMAFEIVEVDKISFSRAQRPKPQRQERLTTGELLCPDKLPIEKLLSEEVPKGKEKYIESLASFSKNVKEGNISVGVMGYNFEALVKIFRSMNLPEKDMKECLVKLKDVAAQVAPILEKKIQINRAGSIDVESYGRAVAFLGKNPQKTVGPLLSKMINARIGKMKFEVNKKDTNDIAEIQEEFAIVSNLLDENAIIKSPESEKQNQDLTNIVNKYLTIKTDALAKALKTGEFKTEVAEFSRAYDELGGNVTQQTLAQSQRTMVSALKESLKTIEKKLGEGTLTFAKALEWMNAIETFSRWFEVDMKTAKPILGKLMAELALKEAPSVAKSEPLVFFDLSQAGEKYAAWAGAEYYRQFQARIAKIDKP